MVGKRDQKDASLDVSGKKQPNRVNVMITEDYSKGQEHTSERPVTQLLF